MENCKTCKGFISRHTGHRCPPAWKVGLPDYDGENSEEWSTFYELSAASAAAAYGEYYDENGDYNIIKGSPITVTVIDSKGVRQYFEVSGESVPRYNARKLVAAPSA